MCPRFRLIVEYKNYSLKAVCFRILSVFLGIGLALISLEIILRFLPVRTEPRVIGLDDIYPVSNFESNRTGIWSKGWNFVMVNKVHTNNYGFINDQDYNPGAKGPLLAIIGDSYVQALYIPYSKSLQGLLEGFSEYLRVYSFGISGAALPRYLIYAEYAKEIFRPEGLVVVIYRNDYLESWYKYKGQPEYYFFESSDSKELVLRRINAERHWYDELLYHSRFYSYLEDNVEVFQTIHELTSYDKSFIYEINITPPKEALADSKRAVDQFLKELPIRAGLSISRILFVVDSIREAIYYPGMFPNADNSYVSVMNEYFIAQATELGYEVIDMHGIFKEHYRRNKRRFDFVHDSHWNGLAHRIVADAVMKSRLFESVTKPFRQ